MLRLVTIGKVSSSFQNDFVYFSNEYCLRKGSLLLGYIFIHYIPIMGDTSWAVMRWEVMWRIVMSGP